MNGIQTYPYPGNHYMNTGDARSLLYLYCADALKRDGRGLCRECLFHSEGGDGTPQCLRNGSGDGKLICPFLELNPHTKGNTTRKVQRR